MPAKVGIKPCRFARVCVDVPYSRLFLKGSYFRIFQRDLLRKIISWAHLSTINNKMLVCTHIIQLSLHRGCISSSISSLCLKACQIQKACYLKHCSQLLFKAASEVVLATSKQPKVLRSDNAIDYI